ncbi:MAG TPA: gluconate 2-dehydrogenase subunit 3 family protein [Gemmatimonadales bacterium]|nr:gluconate 2-dehydrogenase subunit 3 family protein [Gemmatimonadales bacterium]
MQRREALTLIGATALSPLLSPLSAAERYRVGAGIHERAGAQAGQALTSAQMALVTALADTILPQTDTPGAVDVGVPAFVDLLFAEWYPDPERRQLLGGLDAWDARCREARGKSFAELDPGARASWLQQVDGASGASGTPEAAYASLKGSIVFGYLTSRPVAEMQRTTPIIPGRFDGCVPVGGG